MLTGVSSETRVSHQRGDLLGVALGVGSGKFAAGIAGAGNEPGADGIGFDGKPQRLDLLLRRFQLLGRHAGNQQVLPDREPDIAVAAVARDVGEAAHLRDGQAADRHRDADPVQPVLLLRMNAEMRGAAEGRARGQRAGHRAVELAAELFLHQAEEFLDPHFVEHVFEPRLGAVGTVAVIDEHAHHGVGDLAGVGRLHQHAGVAGKAVVAQ